MFISSKNSDIKEYQGFLSLKVIYFWGLKGNLPEFRMGS